MNELALRIRQIAEMVGGLNRLADLMPVPRRTLGNWLVGRQPKPEALQRMAEVAHVRLDWLITGRGEMFARTRSESLVTSWDEDAQEPEQKRLTKITPAEPPAPTSPAPAKNFVSLPVFDVRASAGAGSLVAAEDVTDYFAVGRDWLRRNLPPWAPLDAVVGALENGGDSMEPTVRDGDLLMVVQVTDWRVVERGGIFVFTHHDRLHLKRLQVMMNGDLKVISDNKAYEPWLVPYDDIQHSIRLLGQVFFAGGKPRSY